MNSSVGGDATKLTASRVVTALVTMLAAMMLARFRTLEEFGVYSQLLLVGNLASTILMLGLPNSVNYFLARSESLEVRRRFLSAYYYLSTALGFLTGLVLVLSVPLLIEYFGSPVIRSFAYFLATYPWAKILLSSVDSVLIVHRKINRLFLFKFLNALYLLGIVLIVELAGWTFSGYILLFVIGEAVFAAAVYVVGWRLVGGFTFRIERTFVQSILVYSVPLGLAASVGLLTAQTDKLLIGWRFDAATLAIFANASRELPVTLVATSLTAVLMPVVVRLLSRDDVADAVQRWAYASLLGFAVVAFFAAGMFAFAPDVLSLLYSDKYIPGASVFRVYCVILLFRSTYFGMMLSATGNTRAVLWTSLAALGLNLVLGLPAVYVVGLEGPAFASLVAIGATQVVQLALSSRVLGVSFARIFPWRGLFRIVIVNCVGAAVLYVAKWAIPLEATVGSVLESILLGSVWAVVYCVLLSRKVLSWWRGLNGRVEAN